MMKFQHCSFLLLFLFIALPGKAQRFQFGINSSFIVSQIEGDQLRGFNKIGYAVGLTGGYAFNSTNWLVVSLNNSIFGSQRNSEKASNQSQKILIATELNTLNVLLAYSRRFGDSWDNAKKYRATIGPRIHNLINSDTNIFNKPINEPLIIEDDDFKKLFYSIELGVGAYLTKSLLIDITYNHVPMNILKEPKKNIVKSSPFYLSFRLSYYIF